VKYEMNLYILLRKNSVFKGLISALFEIGGELFAASTLLVGNESQLGRSESQNGYSGERENLFPRRESNPKSSANGESLHCPSCFHCTITLLICVMHCLTSLSLDLVPYVLRLCMYVCMYVYLLR
jgi:hypothetical protein